MFLSPSGGENTKYLSCHHPGILFDTPFRRVSLNDLSTLLMEAIPFPTTVWMYKTLKIMGVQLPYQLVNAGFQNHQLLFSYFPTKHAKRWFLSIRKGFNQTLQTWKSLGGEHFRVCQATLWAFPTPAPNLEKQVEGPPLSPRRRPWTVLPRWGWVGRNGMKWGPYKWPQQMNGYSWGYR